MLYLLESLMVSMSVAFEQIHFQKRFPRLGIHVSLSKMGEKIITS